MNLEKMTLICNIQTIENLTLLNENMTTFDKLNSMSIYELREMQEKLIPIYNTTIKENENEITGN